MEFQSPAQSAASPRRPPTFQDGLSRVFASVARRAEGFCEFRFVFWNKLPLRIDFKPQHGAESEYERQQEHWPIVATGDFRDITEQNPGQERAHRLVVFCAPAIDPGYFLATSMQVGKIMG